MLRYYEISIKYNNNSNAIKYDEMKKYLMDIDLNNKNAMYNLGCYYKKIIIKIKITTTIFFRPPIFK